MKKVVRFKVASASLALVAAMLVQPAYAQGTPFTTVEEEEEEEAAPAEQTGGTILVTGSRIPRPEFEGTIPGSQITAEQIETRSFTNTLDILNDLPIVGPGASPFGTNGGQPASLGASFVDLLDLGTQRTLTLVNGRRYVSGNAASLFVAANATGSQVDLNSIPSALIKNLDVLTVGGAVAYGSDAIAGVVNAVLKDDYEGFDISALGGMTQKGDGGVYRLTGVAGFNFDDDRGNVMLSLEWNHDDALMGDARENILASYSAPTSFLNGSVRNTRFTPALGLNVASGQGAFLPAASDLVPNNIAGNGYRGGSVLVSNPGVIFQASNVSLLPAFQTQGMATTDPQSASLSPRFRPQALVFQAGNTNFVPGVPISAAEGNGCAVTNLSTFCNFAPSALPGTANTAARATFTNAVIAQFAPSIGMTGTAAERDALALQLLQANRPTPREYLIANPNTDINAFIGTGIANYLDVANTGASSAVLSRVAVPLQFNAAGNIFNPVVARLDPRVTPSTTGGAIGGDAFYNPAEFTVLRVRQDRLIANLIARYDVTPDIRIYTENQFSKVVNFAPKGTASSNTIGSSTAENAALMMDINNPFLDAADRAALTAAGVTSKFILSRTNQDIVEQNSAEVEAETIRSVLGVRADFDFLSQPWTFDVSGTYGQNRLKGRSFQIKDIEYALAIDAVRDPNTGNIVCNAQLNPAAYLGRTPSGVVGLETVRVKQADGTYLEQTVRRTVTQAQINACKPLNVFGYNQLSEESRQYVRANTGFTNEAEQLFGLATLGGTLFDLPGGGLGVAFSGEYRRESLVYEPDALSNVGATRTAALAVTEGTIEAWEFSAETRIPVFGEDFTLPLFRNLDLTPGIRMVKQSGSAPDVRLLNGTTLNQEASGKWNTIYSLAGTWRPFEPLTLRGNITRSIRQPSIVELFLGGQPAFTGVTDPCANAQISRGVFPSNRRANCRQAVIAAGLATDTASADTFLNSYVPSGTAVSGTFAGTPGLLPERGESWTVGGVFTPAIVPSLKISADYINVTVKNQIVPTTIVTALELCYDSPTFNNTSAQLGGINTCTFFNRIPQGQTRQFEVDNNFNSGFINLGSLKVKAVNASIDYETSLDDVFGENAGELSFFGNVYHLMDYLSAPDGNLATAQQSAGSTARPKWEVQARVRYENEGFFTQWTTNWQSQTRLFSSGALVQGTNDANEVQDFIILPQYALHDWTIGYRFGADQRYRLQFTVRNVTDKQYVGQLEKVYGLGLGRLDDFGRRFVLTAGARF